MSRAVQANLLGKEMQFERLPTQDLKPVVRARAKDQVCQQVRENFTEETGFRCATPDRIPVQLFGGPSAIPERPMP